MAAGSTGSSGENITHFNAVRMRVKGNGNLKLKFIGLDGDQEQDLKPLVLSSAPGRELTRLANFKGMRAQLEIKTTVINEIFNINRITIFSKESETSYPG